MLKVRRPKMKSVLAFALYDPEVMYRDGVDAGVANMITMTIAPAIPANMKPYRRIDARAAEALVFASRHAIGFDQTFRGLRVRSPLLSLSFCSAQLRSVTVDCAMRRSSMIDGITSRKLSVNI